MRRRLKLILGVVLIFVLLVPSSVKPEKVAAGGFCDWIQFVADVTIPDGVPVDPGFIFRKTWRLKNIGTCTWTRSYQLVFVGGEQMGGLAAVNLPRDVTPGQTIDLTVDLTAPTTPGVYRGYWQLQNASGGLFGFGPAANKAFWLEIQVRGSTAPVVYDFAANTCAANWRSEIGGKLPCPGVIGDDVYGLVMKLDRPTLESGTPSTSHGILMLPPHQYNQAVFGIFPPFEVKRGDRFQALIGCEYGAAGCEVQFVLQYKDENTSPTLRSLWNAVEKYDGKYYKVDLSLSSLEGRTISFVLMTRPYGDTSHDRALWVNPVIVRTSAPVPPGPTPLPLPSTPVPVPTASTLSPGSSCDRASFVSDVSVPDGTVFAPGQAFTKTWRLKNVGTCTWTTSYSIVFSSGEQMGGPAALNLPNQVAPGQTVDLSLNLIAPATAGTYRGYWLLKNASGKLFGISSLGTKPFWLEIKVSGTPSTSAGYDFVANVCQAQWMSGWGVLPCPGADWAEKGYILTVNSPRLENNTVDSRSGLLTGPQYVYNGYIQGIYPPYTVQSGDRFQSIVNCEYGAKGCYVIFRLDYLTSDGQTKTLWSFGEKYEGLYYQADVDLSPLAGQTVRFGLMVSSAGSPTADRAIWVAPRIARSAPIVFTPTATPTSPPVVSTSTLTSQPPVVVPTSTLTSPPPVVVPTETPTLIPTNTPTATSSSSSLDVRVFFFNQSRFNSGAPPYEIGVWRPIFGFANLPQAVLTEYFKGPTPAEAAQGLSAVYSGVTGFSKLEIQNGVARVYLTGQCNSQGAIYTIAQPLMVNLLQFGEIQYVKIYDQNGSTEIPDGPSNSIPGCLEP